MIVLPSYVSQFHLSTKYYTAAQLAEIKGNIIALAQIGAVIGAFFTFIGLEKFGRLKALRFACAVALVATTIQITSKQSLGQIYVGRILLGSVTGRFGVIAPTYIAEIAPKAIRGACGICFGGSYFIGLILGYFANYGVARHVSAKEKAQWQIPLSLTYTFPVIILTLSLGAPESPRWLLKKGRSADALKVLQRLRCHELIRGVWSSSC